MTAIADKLGVEFALIHRKRNGKSLSAPEHMEILVGDVRGKVRWSMLFLMFSFYFFLQVAILVDDMIDTGSTLMLAARTLHEKGAKSVHALISHGIGLVFFILVLHSTYPFYYIRASFGSQSELDR